MMRPLTWLSTIGLSSILITACEKTGDASKDPDGGTDTDTDTGTAPDDPRCEGDPDCPLEAIERADWQPLDSGEIRDPAPVASAEELAAYAAGNLAFGLDLAAALVTNDPSENLVISPYSLQIALGMTYAGARTITEEEIASTLHFAELGQERLHETLNAVDLQLADRNLEGTEEEDPLILSTNNSLWLNPPLGSWSEEWIDLVVRNYGSSTQTMELAAESEASREVVNWFTERRTGGLIQDFLPPGLPNGYTTGIILNTLYLKAPWLTALDKAGEGTFMTLTGEVMSPRVAGVIDDVLWAEGDGYQAVDIPMRGSKVSFAVIVPDAGSFLDFESSLTAESLATIIDGLAPGMAVVNLPTLDYASASLSLRDALSDLGMPSAFSGADLSGMGGGAEEIQDVIHKVALGLDEKGIEAAAASGVIVGEDGGPEPDLYLTVDRPFLLLVRDRPTNVILFYGRIVDPTK